MRLGPMFLQGGEEARPPAAPVGRHALAVLKESTVWLVKRTSNCW